LLPLGAVVGAGHVASGEGSPRWNKATDGLEVQHVAEKEDWFITSPPCMEDNIGTHNLDEV